MKKTICISLLMLLTSCGASQSDIDSAKQELLWNTQETQEERETVTQKTDVQENSLIQIIPLDADPSLIFDDISQKSLSTWEVVISWKTSRDVDKIEVFFTNPTSKYSDDRYMLQAYRPEQWIFKYIASSKNQVLDFGQNEYVFRAYSWITENETKVILNVPNKNEEEIIGTELNMIGEEENMIVVDLPTSSKYGEPMKLGEASFTYTQIKGFEINKEILESVSCENLTDYLSERINTWYYWNTCRDIVKDAGIKFNVIRLDGERYVYERHYIDFKHGFYGTYELEVGEWVTSENIWDKNSELKIREFPSLEIVDDLMKDIVNS